MSGKMTPKQAIFAAEYLIDGNGTRAAIAAGFEAASAHVQSARLLRNAKVAAAIQAGQARLAEKLELSAMRVLQELMKLAYFDAGKLYDDNGERIPVHRLDPHTRAAIVAVEDESHEGAAFVTTRVQRVKMADKGQNLERLGKHLKLFGADGAFGATVQLPGGLPDDSTIRIVLVRPE
jgi:phage terminase small subunit